MANIAVHVNHGASDVVLGTSGYAGYTEFSEGNDKLIFSDGNTAVADAADIPSEAELTSAGIKLQNPLSQIILDTYFFQDTGSNVLRDIELMGNLDSRYVLAFDFDASTGSEPTLEAWDDSNLNTITSTVLGAGTPASSFIRGIATTSASAGAGWATTTGIKMAGAGSGNFIFLNSQNGALSAANTLYATLCLVIPASQSVGFSLNPIFVVKWLDS